MFKKLFSLQKHSVRVTLSLKILKKQQRSIFHHYKISNFSIIQGQKNTADIVAVGDDKNKKRRKGKERYKSHKIIIFHVFAEKPPILANFLVERDGGCIVSLNAPISAIGLRQTDGRTDGRIMAIHQTTER